MSEARSALGGATHQGRVTIREAGVQGMITLRGDLGSEKVKKALKAATGASVPGQREVVFGKGGTVAWMSPDELLLVVERDAASGMLAGIEKALAGAHHLAVDVSDARALFEISGDGGSLREVIAKLCPVDMAPGAFRPGQIRRTRMAQVAAAFWMVDERTIRIIAFRSVAEYVFGLLKDAAQAGGDVGIFG